MLRRWLLALIETVNLRCLYASRHISDYEKREIQRHRALKTGTICMDDKSIFDCLVRDLSTTGPCLEIESPNRHPWRIYFDYESGPYQANVPGNLAVTASHWCSLRIEEARDHCRSRAFLVHDYAASAFSALCTFLKDFVAKILIVSLSSSLKHHQAALLSVALSLASASLEREVFSTRGL